MAAYSADYTAHATAGSRPFPGVPEALRALHDEGWLLAVCTNKPEAAARVLLEGLGLAPLLAAVGGGDSFPTRKPDPAHLLGTLHAAGGVPEHAVMAGDHANDVLRGAGSRAALHFRRLGLRAAGNGAGRRGGGAQRRGDGGDRAAAAGGRLDGLPEVVTRFERTPSWQAKACHPRLAGGDSRPEGGSQP